MKEITDQEWAALMTKVDEIHEAVYGNGEPEKSLLSRLSWAEARIKGIIGVGVAMTVAALAALLKGI